MPSLIRLNRRAESVRDINHQNFGILIAYVIPGFVALWGIAIESPEVSAWLQGSSISGPTVGGFLYVTIASVGLGMLASLFRWATLDQLNKLTGLSRPTWDDRRLKEQLFAFEALVENHFRYYQFYANTIIASIPSYFLWRLNGSVGWKIDIAYVCLLVVLIAGARNALGHYYRRGSLLLGNACDASGVCESAALDVKNSVCNGADNSTE